MAGRLLTLRRHTADGPVTFEVSQDTRGKRSLHGSAAFSSDEIAARYYLSQLLGRDARAELRAIMGSGQHQLVPDMKLRSVHTLPKSETRLVRFEQTHRSRRIFGACAVVELARNRSFQSADADLAGPPTVSDKATLSETAALERVVAIGGMTPESIDSSGAPELVFYKDGEDLWHLAFHFRNIPTAPAEPSRAPADKPPGPVRAPSPQVAFPHFDHLVDAHDGRIILSFPSGPTATFTAAPPVQMWIRCTGCDDSGAERKFFGTRTGEEFVLHDRARAIKTYDLDGSSYTSALPPDPVREASGRFVNSAAVSAHANATDVYDFYNSVLLRDGIDGNRMELVSVVNCTDPSGREWPNACWWEGQMWYGRSPDATGGQRSWARHLDIIGHELTHGVTAHTAGLIYQGESGALNESFSDIFGITIMNWYGRRYDSAPGDGVAGGPDSDAGTWCWRVGDLLGGGGKPLRDMSDPTRTGDPEHMSAFDASPDDNGGVHKNGNIHNKAAYNVFMAQDRQKKRVFPSRDVAILYYACLLRLSGTATFGDALASLVDAVKTLYAAESPRDRAAKIRVIRAAYAKAGIH